MNEQIKKGPEQEREAQPKKASPIRVRTLTTRTGVRAGDLYMQNPRGSNDRSNG